MMGGAYLEDNTTGAGELISAEAARAGQMICIRLRRLVPGSDPFDMTLIIPAAALEGVADSKSNG